MISQAREPIERANCSLYSEGNYAVVSFARTCLQSEMLPGTRRSPVVQHICEPAGYRTCRVRTLFSSLFPISPPLLWNLLQHRRPMTPAPDSHSRNAEASDSLVAKTDRREREQAVLTPPSTRYKRRRVVHWHPPVCSSTSRTFGKAPRRSE